MQIHNAVITGSFSYNGADLSNVTSSNQSSASLSTRVTQIEQVYATTGSNSFRATQSITGSLTVTGQITAQTLNVQQVTSSIVYSSGSNVFGCDLNSRQTFTGSVLMTGSLIVNTTGPELQVNNNGVILGNLQADNHSITGSLRVTGSLTSFSGCVGIGGVIPTRALDVNGTLRIVTPNRSFFVTSNAYSISDGTLSSGIGMDGDGLYLGSVASSTGWTIANPQVTIRCSGNVGIGTCSPNTRLSIQNDGASQYANSGWRNTSSTAELYIGVGGSSVSATFAQNNAYIVNAGASALVFGTTDTERMRITSAGNVGINSNSPCARLHVQGNAALEDLLYFCAGGSVNTKFVYTIASGADDAFILRRNHTTQGNLCIMSWTYNGFVGVGTVTPTALLQVRGPNAAGVFFDAQNDGAGGATFNRINASSFPYNQYTFLNGYLGIGTNSPSYTLHVEAPSNSIAGYFKAGGTSGYAALAFTGNGGSNIGVLTTTSGCLVLGRSNGSVPNQFGANLDFLINCANGNILINSSLGVVGSVSKGSGSFKIKHPLASKKCTHQLVHSFIEGPQADLIYSGHTALQNGISCINMDCAARMTEGTFLALNRCLRVFTTNETSWDQVKGRMIGNVLIVESQNTESNDEISWMVIGERQDEHMLETEWTDDEGRVITEPEIVE